jgi:hypothetical protein
MRPAPAITTSPDETFSGAKPASALAENARFDRSHFRAQNRLPLLLKMLILPVAFSDAKPVSTFAENALETAADKRCPIGD